MAGSRFYCSRCGLGDFEVGHLARPDEPFCPVCREEDGGGNPRRRGRRAGGGAECWHMTTEELPLETAFQRPVSDANFLPITVFCLGDQKFVRDRAVREHRPVGRAGAGGPHPGSTRVSRWQALCPAPDVRLAQLNQRGACEFSRTKAGPMKTLP